MTEQLKPCPFCGGKAKTHHYSTTVISYGIYVMCKDCMTSSKYYDTKRQAIEAWNKRAYPRPKGKWLRYDREGNAYECSLCHEVWQLMEGTPAENKMKYCQSCGAEMTYSEDEEEAEA